MSKKFNAQAWAEGHLVFEESSTEINDGAAARLAELLQRAYAAGQSVNKLFREVLERRIAYLSEIKATNPHQVVKDNCNGQIEALQFVIAITEARNEQEGVG